jgi:hypothetical protein
MKVLEQRLQRRTQINSVEIKGGTPGNRHLVLGLEIQRLPGPQFDIFTTLGVNLTLC